MALIHSSPVRRRGAVLGAACILALAATPALAHRMETTTSVGVSTFSGEYEDELGEQHGGNLNLWSDDEDAVDLAEGSDDSLTEDDQGENEDVNDSSDSQDEAEDEADDSDGDSDEADEADEGDSDEADEAHNGADDEHDSAGEHDD